MDLKGTVMVCFNKLYQNPSHETGESYEKPNEKNRSPDKDSNRVHTKYGSISYRYTNLLGRNNSTDYETTQRGIAKFVLIK
jgi:hypothetical protein